MDRRQPGVRPGGDVKLLYIVKEFWRLGALSVGPSSFLGEIRYLADGTYIEGGGRPGAREASSGLPCLSRNNSTEGGGEGESVPLFNRLTGANKRTAHAMMSEIVCLASEFGIDRLGFLTLTFPDHVTCRREANRRFNSLATHVLKKRFVRVIVAWERHESNRLHVHALVVHPQDIRSGINFEEIKRRNYRSANPALREEWAFWRSITNYDGKHPDHAFATFGRTELLPVKSTAEAVARYVGSYISKNVKFRPVADRGARNVSWIGFPKGKRVWNSRFSWATPRSALWRLQVRAFAKSVGAETFGDLARLFGPRWCYFLYQEILATPVETETVIEHTVSPSLQSEALQGSTGQRSGAELDPAQGGCGVEHVTGEAAHGRKGRLVPVGADGVAVDLTERAEVMARVRYEDALTEGGLLPHPSAFPSMAEWEAACAFVQERRAADVARRRTIDERRQLEETWTELKRNRQWWKVGA